MRAILSRASKALTAGLLGLGLLVVAFVYAPALDGEFLFDDIPMLAQLDCWRGLAWVPEIFLGDNDCIYRPVRWVSFALDYELVGGEPRGLHVSNLIYHGLTIVAVFALLRRFTGSFWAAALCIVWGLHPVHADAVAYISGRRDILSSLFYLVGILVVFPRVGRARMRGWLLGLVCFWLAFQTKEMAVTWPAAVAMIAFFRAPGHGRAVFAKLKPYWPLALAVVLLTGWFVAERAFLTSKSHMQGAWWGGSPASNFATASVLVTRYLGLLVWPSPLIGDYFPTTIVLAEGFGDPRALVGLGVIAIYLLVLVLATLRRWVAVGVGLAWLGVTLLPVLHVFPHHELFAEHYLYLPSIGLFIALSGLGRFLRVGAARPEILVAVVLTAGVVTGFAWQTHTRSQAYQTELAFYEAAYVHAPDNARVLYHLGVIHTERNECELALPFLRGASGHLTDTSVMGRETLVAYVICSQRTGETAGVPSAVERLLSAWPNHAFGLRYRARQAYIDGDLDSAEADLRRAVASGDPGNPQTLSMLAEVLRVGGQTDEALAVVGQFEGVHRGLCEQEVLAYMARPPDGFHFAFERAQDCLEVFPQSMLLHDVRARLFIMQGRGEQARVDIDALRRLGATEAQLSELLEQLARLP